MKATLLLFVAGGFLASGLLSARAGVIHSYDRLPIDQQIMLQQSEERVAAYDYQLRALDAKLRHRRISPADYQNTASTYVFYIGEESRFQNALLTHSSDLPQRAKDVLETMEHGILAIPVGLTYLVSCFPQCLELLALIR